MLFDNESPLAELKILTVHFVSVWVLHSCLKTIRAPGQAVHHENVHRVRQIRENDRCHFTHKNEVVANLRNFASFFLEGACNLQMRRGIMLVKYVCEGHVT